MHGCLSFMTSSLHYLGSAQGRMRTVPAAVCRPTSPWLSTPRWSAPWKRNTLYQMGLFMSSSARTYHE
jgi:hypothetical protein